MPPDPPSNSVVTQCNVIIFLGNKPFLKDFLKNSYQIYSMAKTCLYMYKTNIFK